MGTMAAVLDWIYRPRCVACDGPVAGRSGFCEACWISVDPAAPARVPPLAAVHAPFGFGGQLAVALRRLKFGNRPDIARGLGPLLAPHLAAAAASCEVMVPVPLHFLRAASRGYNQSALLARYASKSAGLMLPLENLSLRRVRNTQPQTGLDRRARQQNLAGAFEVAPRRRRRLGGKRVLLCDDVMTTGATLAAAAQALIDGGAKAVVGFCPARAESPAIVLSGRPDGEEGKDRR